MGKGRLVLVPLKELKEGIRVAFGSTKDCKDKPDCSGFIVAVETLATYGCEQVRIEVRPRDSQNFTIPVPFSYLQQIAIEYEEDIRSADSFDLTTYRKKVTILLSPDDYEKALPLIGQEVELNQFMSGEYFGPKAKEFGLKGNEHIAVLITPSPIVYTEEEVRILAAQYASDMYDRIAGGTPPIDIEDWWDKHKKK